jgi:hypothetical protein
MDEREVVKEYRSLSKSKQSDIAKQIENIDKLKTSVTPQQNIQLKAIAVGAAKHEGSLRSRSIQLLDKKINQIVNSMSKESKENAENINQLNTNAKIQHSVSIRNRRLKNKFNKTKRTKKPILSPINEGSKESASKSASPTWRNVMSPRKKKTRKLFFGLF